MRGPAITSFVTAIGLGLVAVACAPERTDREPDMPPERAEPPPLPPELADPDRPPEPDLFLPPLEGYVTDDDAEPGELESSLDHGSVPYAAVRRRLIIDERGFATGEVTVVTVAPGTGGAERVLDHRFGEASRTPIRIEGVQMLRIETEPHFVLAWTGPGFVVTFARGQGRTDEWLEELARAVVRAMARVAR